MSRSGFTLLVLVACGCFVLLGFRGGHPRNSSPAPAPSGFSYSYSTSFTTYPSPCCDTGVAYRLCKTDSVCPPGQMESMNLQVHNDSASIANAPDTLVFLKPEGQAHAATYNRLTFVRVHQHKDEGK